MKIKQLPRIMGSYALTGVLTVGVIIAFGLLSASGMLLVTPAAMFAVGAFIFGGVVEGEVFKQEIFEGLQDIALLGKRGFRHLITTELDEAVADSHPEPGFLSEYQRVKRYLQAVHGKQLTMAQQAQKAEAKKRLQHMQKFFAKQVQALHPCTLPPYADDVELQNEVVCVRRKLSAMRAKMTIFRIALPFSLLCGAGFGLATAAALPAAIAAIGISLGFMVWPLAVMAAVGYAFLIFHTAKDILFGDSFKRWQASIKKWFVPGPQGVTPGFVIKAAGISLLAAVTVALCVMGTLATAGTWWIAVKHGAKLIPNIQAAAHWVRNILTPLAAFGNFIFSVFNSFESINTVIETVSAAKPLQNLKAAWQALRAKENWLQILNPFRIVCRFVQKFMDIFLLLGHTAASGVARDRFLNIPPEILAGTSAVCELGQDIPFFFEEGKKTMTQKATIILLSPLLFLSGCWQYLASRCNPPATIMTFKQSLKDAFDIRDKKTCAIEVPPQSANWRTVEIQHYFKKEEKRLDRTLINRELAQEKKAVLIRRKEQLLANNILNPEDISVSDAAILNQHRLFSSTQPTRSHLFAERMDVRYGANRVR